MPTDYIPFKNTGYFSQLICDYLEEKESIQDYYNRFPNIENFKSQIEEKKKTFHQDSRKELAEVLKKQYELVDVSSETLQNIEALKDENTFSVTTGHQLNLFTGPLYFLYKIISAINLAKQLQATYSEYNFVPVYWMATEDHDFEEINYFNFNGKKLRWNRPSSGAVGELDTQGLDAVFDLFSQELGVGNHAEELRELFKNAYLKHNNLAEATRYIANHLFKSYGLVVVDANDKALKQEFIPYIKQEVEAQLSYKTVSETNANLEKSGYPIQVNPREINLFYIEKGIRERIVFEKDMYRVLNTEISFSKAELLQRIDSHPEQFSPNVIMRPLYQEVILPNLCYIGGGGELAYWLQLKAYFETVKVPFPILLLRNSVLIKTEQQSDKLEKLNISNSDLFLKRESLINKKVREISNIDIDFSEQLNHLKQQFSALYTLAEQTDKSFLGAVKAQERKQIKGLEYLEKRLLTAQKRKLKDHVIRITEHQNALFPNQSLQERNLNFSQLYLVYGAQLIHQLVLNLQPLNGNFLVLKL